MSTTSTTEITAAEWLAVRDHVAGVVKKAAPNTAATTTVNVAEQLLRLSLIDVEKIRDDLRQDATTAGDTIQDE